MDKNKFDYTDYGSLISDINALGCKLPEKEDAAAVLQPLTLGGQRIRNRIVAQPIEGCDALADGAPSMQTAERYTDMARSGYGALWMESTAVCAQGRTNARQLFMTEENVSAFADLVKSIKTVCDTPPYLILQLTHSGRSSRPTPVCAIENPLIPVENAHMISDGEIAEVEDCYVRSAELAAQAGFDAVDIRSCHGYLINELFSAYERPGIYGGCFENRVRMLLNIIDKLRAKRLGIELCVRLNAYDALPLSHSWGCTGDIPPRPNMDEPLRLIRLLRDRDIRLINVSAGIGAYCPQVIRPFDRVRANDAGSEPPLKNVMDMLKLARRVKQEAPEMTVVASALTWLREYAPAVASSCIAEGWFDMAGFGRQSIAYPDFPMDVISGAGMDRARCCTTCGGCTGMVKKGGALRCVRRGVGK